MTTRRWLTGTPVDVLLTAVVFGVQAILAMAGVGDGDSLDAFGWTLLIVGTAPLVVRRRWPGLSLLAMMVLCVPYHLLDYAHEAFVLAPLVAMYTVASFGPLRRTLVVGVALALSVLSVMALWGGSGVDRLDLLASVGWVPAALGVGEAVRLQRSSVAAIVERAERAERTREEEAARRVVEERIRIARDLHDLLAHSITLIGVQATVAGHVLVENPDRLDRAAVASSLETISDTCREARAELRTTLAVLRAGEPEPTSPVPGLAGIPDLVAGVRGAGLDVDLAVTADDASVPFTNQVAIYRIVQEALTNVVKHAGATRAEVSIDVADNDGVRVRVVDNGAGEPSSTSHVVGHGIIGMTERARSVGGTLSAGPRPHPERGFAVSAFLPVDAPVDARLQERTDDHPGAAG